MKYAAFLLGMAVMASAIAGQSDAVPSCYDSKLPTKSVPLDTELFVAIDQSTLLDNALMQSVADNIRPLLAQNNGFSIITFSAYTQGRYMEVKVSGKLDPAMDTSQRNDISKPLLAKFDQCMAKQAQYAGQLIGTALRNAFDGTSSEIAKSDVLGSLKAISLKVRESTARNKVVLLVSDMLENSSISSFYDKGQSVRKIDPAKEMKLAEESQMIGDFSGARIYVIGAGLLSDDANKSKRYRDPKTMQALSAFWQTYFEKSKGQLVEFGQPALLNPIRRN
ncbi:hypothetical protein [Noviherbaspirillum saxi]|uniref:VWFA domain-containing protein n=1 Tax=Noviherbaspirillum saxi TaxID=2320863 RepID=A0A3A3FKI9_9BURK|nr:hypothetical protein [Noviherbaspirillum saxi]RJF96003.1 hypothetical protein D3871_21905 [Noviherbaspirillum saxi]